MVALVWATAAAPATAQTWNFDVRLDGKPIGTHRFAVSGPDEARAVESIARFDVKLLGITVYRYQHEAHERWRGDCLQSLQARTEDGGDAARLVDIGNGHGLNGCAMGYAYWHPALTQQTRLLNPQTGQFDDARFERLSDAPLMVNGREVDAMRWQLTTTATSGKTARQTLTLWLERSSGRWIGLDGQAQGGRLLTYRLP